MKVKRVEHIAIAVDSLKESIDLLGRTFGLPLEYEEQIGQTRLAMLPVGETYIELLEGQGPESGVTKWITEKGAGLFHICFEVDDVHAEMVRMADRGAVFVDDLPHPGAVGMVSFIHPSSAHGVLVEINQPPGDEPERPKPDVPY